MSESESLYLQQDSLALTRTNTMNSLWPSRAPQEVPVPEKPTDDIADTGEVADVGSEPEQPDKPPVPAPPSRPPLQRNTLQNAPPAPMPPPTDVQQPTDSLSLMQLRRIVAEFNRSDPVAYDFVYSDMGPHPEELDEWFAYQPAQWQRLHTTQKAFEWHWQHEFDSERGWDDADNDIRARFIQAAIGGVQSNDAALRSVSISKLVYLVLGRWGDTAMPNASSEDHRSVASKSQLQAIKAGVECLSSLEGLPVIWEALRSSFELHW